MDKASTWGAMFCQHTRCCALVKNGWSCSQALSASCSATVNVELSSSSLSSKTTDQQGRTFNLARKCQISEAQVSSGAALGA